MKKQIFVSSICLLCIFLAAPSATINAQTNNCPTSIRARNTSPCSNTTAPGFYMVFSAPYVGTDYDFTFNFGSNAPSECQSMTFQTTNCSNILVDNQAPYCHFPSPTGTLTMPGGNTVCNYVSGNLTGQQNCNQLLPECSGPLTEIAENFVGSSVDCRLWEGPCTEESGIWRTGNVYINTNTATYGYKLGVKGGITTEMLQLCVPEWCDYVFSDTFNLMPLRELQTFIGNHKYLPGCTPGQVIEQDGGFSLSDETVNQQEKIEEFFLHLIATQKRLDKLEKRIPGPFSSPGLPVENMEATVPTVAPPVVQITCFQIKSAPNGIGGLTVVPNAGPYKVVWSGPTSGQIDNLICDGTIKINNLSAGTYNVTVCSASVQVGVCSFQITSSSTSNCGLFDDPLCKKAIVDMLTAAITTAPACKQWAGDLCSHTAQIYHLGTVGIGTNVGRAGYSLAVKGGIITDKFRVELCEPHGWCDYVFEEDYALAPLYEVESFIKRNKRLPGTISQNEVTRDGGFEMRSVKLDHQKKIEEAYLYLIALDKQKKNLQKKLNILSEQY